ncbi:MAG: hypothetical protein LBG27_02660 [Spirochaetaceae bacterium]|jgi:hypothetical protein|nr:hypothetical protein [Spirochaetaceae bacterium]
MVNCVGPQTAFTEAEQEYQRFLGKKVFGGTVYGSGEGTNANTAPNGGAALYKGGGMVTRGGTPFTRTTKDNTF